MTEKTRAATGGILSQPAMGLYGPVVAKMRLAMVLFERVYFLIGASARFVRITSRAFFTTSFFELMSLKYSFLSHTL